MPRWKQVVDENGKSQLVPIDEAAARRDGHFVQGDIEPFVSPIDNSVISDRKQLAEHNKRHGVVQTQEFNPEFLERKRAERERLYKGEHTKAEKLARKQEIYEAITRAERANQ